MALALTNAARREPRMTKSPSEVLFAEDVHKRFGTKKAQEHVLRGATLRVTEGEFVALVGQSGSGKSTLLSILGGLDREYLGQVRVFAQNLASLSDRALSHLRNRQIGFVFQAFHLLDHQSCLENVLLPNAFAESPLPPAAATERAREALHRVGLVDRARSYPTELSGGQRQRIAIARALYFRPRLLLCDEPTGNLDVQTGQRIIELFADLSRQEGLTLLLVTHEPRVAEVAQRILRMENGRAVSATLDDLRLTQNSEMVQSVPPAPETQP